MMMQHRKRAVIALSAILLAPITFIDAADADSEESPPDQNLALVGATIYPSPTDPPVANGVVVVRGGKIEMVSTRDQVALPSDARVLDCSGMTIVAGFQNSHIHFTEPGWQATDEASEEELSRQLEEMLLRFGFTTVVDTGSSLDKTLDLRKKIDSGVVRGPRILTAGTPLYPPDAIPFYLKDTLSPELLATLHTPSSPEDASAITSAQIEGGADVLKLFVGSWAEPGHVVPMPLAIAKAAADKAHDHNKLVFAHASNIQGLEVALEAGVDILAHALDDDRGFEESHIQRMLASEMALIPTLKLFGGQVYTKYIQLLVSDFAKAGGQILFGTDVGYLTDYDPTEEYELMAGSGLSWNDILVSLTTAPAKKFGEQDRRGMVAAHYDADLVVLGSDPAVDLGAFTDIRHTLRGGQVVYSATP